MAKRLLKDWTKSDRVDGLTADAERFFVRLIMKADDFGCFYADTRLLKADLFPLKLDKVREADLLRWLAECQKAGLIVLYEADQKKYLQIVDFGQRKRQMTPKFPMPPTYSSPPPSAGNCPPEVEVEDEEEGEDRSERTARKVFIKPSLDEIFSECQNQDESEKFFNYYESNGWRAGRNPMKDWRASLKNWIKNAKNYGANRTTIAKTGKSDGANELAASLKVDVLNFQPGQ